MPRLSLLLPTDSSEIMEFLSLNGGLFSTCIESIARGNLRRTSSLVLGALFCSLEGARGASAMGIS